MNIFYNLNKLKKILIHGIFWVFVWMFYGFYFGFKSNNEAYIKWFSLVLVPITMVNTYFSVYYLIPKYLVTKKYNFFILYETYTLISTAFIVTNIMTFGFVYKSNLHFNELPPLGSNLLFILISMYLVILMVSAYKIAKHYYLSMEQNKALENKFLQTQLQLKEEELKFLKMQIHPHFLFNTLNTIYGFALKKADETPKMILKLSNLLDYILYQIDKPKVLLIDEVNHIEDYISLEKIRFHDTLKVNFNALNIDPSIKIAPMLLIPFVENSFKHGNMINGILVINIIIETKNNNLMLKISNSIIEKNNIDSGIGLQNIKKRLDMLYQKQYELSIEVNNGTFEVILKLRTNA